MKKAMILLLAVLLATFGLAGCGDGGTYKKAAEALAAGAYSQALDTLDTIPEYEDSEGIRAYAEAALSFQAAAAALTEKNTAFDSVIASAQGLLDSGQAPLDESTATDLQVAISGAREAQIKAVVMPGETAAILAEVERMNAADYSSHMAELQASEATLENSILQMEQITNPTGDFVILRLSEIDGIEEMQGVTEDNDPNNMLHKQGGYTSSTYFSSALIDQSQVYGANLIEKGTDAGGCIEVYPSVEDAEARNTYLAAFDGSGFLSPGSHVVYGTIVIRTSSVLTASQQQELTEEIMAVLVALR